ncbi:hypothetical protein WN944_022306 [Citrus x changshan-huyou]|uniref:GINS subunit domain-containing protein n=1 Tax=Citrus x changshan-huyou TaxID=2935761 RepID=A0AAP0N452_9ROSI
MHGRLGSRLVKELASGEKGQLTHFNDELLNEVIKECSENFLALQSLIRKMQEEGLDFQTTRNADHYGALINHLSLIRNKRCLMAYMYNRAEMIQNLAWTVGLRLFELPEEIQEKLSHLEKDYFKRHSAALESYMSKVDLNLNVWMPQKSHENGSESLSVGLLMTKVHLSDEESEGFGNNILLSVSIDNVTCCKKSLIKIVLINQIFKANVLVSAKDMVPPKDPYIKVRVLDDLGEGIVVSDKAANFARHSMHFLKRTDAEPYISRVFLAQQGLMEELTG